MPAGHNELWEAGPKTLAMKDPAEAVQFGFGIRSIRIEAGFVLVQ